MLAYLRALRKLVLVMEGLPEGDRRRAAFDLYLTYGGDLTGAALRRRATSEQQANYRGRHMHETGIVDALETRLGDLLGVTVLQTEREARLGNYRVDLVAALADRACLLVEIKRFALTESAWAQLDRYLAAARVEGRDARGVLVGPRLAGLDPADLARAGIAVIESADDGFRLLNPRPPWVGQPSPVAGHSPPLAPPVAGPLAAPVAATGEKLSVPPDPPLASASGGSIPEPRALGSNGQITQKPQGLYAPGFLLFWSLYPRKAAKDAAWRAWQKRGCEPKTDAICSAVEQQRSYLMRGDTAKQPGELCPHPATWINGGRWQDEPLPMSVSLSTAKTAGNHAAAEAFLANRQRERQTIDTTAREVL